MKSLKVPLFGIIWNKMEWNGFHSIQYPTFPLHFRWNRMKQKLFLHCIIKICKERNDKFIPLCSIPLFIVSHFIPLRSIRYPDITFITKKNQVKNVNNLTNVEVFCIMTQPAKISCKFSCSESFTSSWQTHLSKSSLNYSIPNTLIH
jgi:hypothetical protein